MSALGGTNFRIGTEVVLDLDQFRAELKGAVRSANEEGKTLGDRLKSGFQVAANAAIALGLTVRNLEKAYDAVVRSVERMAAQRGESDPAVQAFHRLQRAATGAFDSLVGGVLSAGVVQTSFNAISEKLIEVGRSFEGLGERIDAFVKRHTPEIGATVAGVTRLFGYAEVGFAVLKGAFQEFVAFSASAYSAVFAKLAESVVDEELARAAGA